MRYRSFCRLWGPVHPRRILAVALVVWLAPSQNVPTAFGAGYNWTQFNGDARHSGNNTLESSITASTVPNLRSLFDASLPATADGAPAYLSAVSTATGTRDLVFVTTKAGHIRALDAHSGALIWSHQYGPGSCTINNGSSPCYTTSSPAIDPTLQYVYTYGLDGYVHKLAVGTGNETTGSGWPALATTKGFNEKGSSALSVATTPGGAGYLYVTNGGYPGDNGDYQGHLTAIDLATGAQHVFNALCSDQVDVHFVETPGTPDCSYTQSAVWARPGAVYDDATNRVYIATGNGDYNPSVHDWGDSVLALNPDGTGAGGTPLDSYTPPEYASLQASDTDLGSTAPAILPASAIPAASTYKHLAVQGGKDGYLRLLNLDNLSGQSGPGHTGGAIQKIAMPSAVFSEILSQPATWVNPADQSIWVFVTNNQGIAAFSLSVASGGVPSLQARWSTSMAYRDSLGSSPLVANGVLFDARNNLVEALNPTTGQQLWHDGTIGGIHWESPVVANGVLYITDESATLHAYSLLPPTIQAAAGWNMVGGNPPTLWTDSTVKWAFNASVPAWYHPTGGEAAGTGIWEYVSTPGARSVTVQACAGAVTVAAVAHRWNLLGNPCGADVALPSTALAYWWDPNTTAYVPVTGIRPGAAAWVKPAGSTVTLTPTTTHAPALRRQAATGRSWHRAAGRPPRPPALPPAP
ncbi:MAG: hypothetical protein NVSMB22_10030 [Chloroflexota bacterium]